MRVTDSMVYSSSLQQLQNQFSALNTVSVQVSSGQRNAAISDDPVAGGQVMQLQGTTAGITQYQRNISSVQAGLNGEESALNQLTDLLNSAKEIATSQAGDTANASTRASAGVQVQSILSQAIALGNTQIGDQYIFGGTQTGAAPFAADGTYSGNATVPQAQIGNNTMIGTVDSGAAIFVNSGVISSLQTLSTALSGNDAATIQNVMSNLDTAINATGTSLAEVGSKTNQLNAASTAFQTQQTAVTAQQSAVQDIPLEEASLHLAQVQNALQAGLLATSKILQTSLVTYLTGTSIP